MSLNIGHIYLAGFRNGTGAHLVRLIEGLARLGARQHVFVSSRDLAMRLSSIANVTVGPPVSSPIMGFCLMPTVDLLHVHDESSGKAGLLLTLTRSTPFVVTRRDGAPTSHNALLHAVYRRAGGVICESRQTAALMRHYVSAARIDVIRKIVTNGDDDCESLSNEVAAEHMSIYRHVVDRWQSIALA